MDKKNMKHNLILFVGSSIYGNEDLLENFYKVLTEISFEVWMSYKGKLPVVPGKTNPEICLDAVEKADCFIGILTGRSGSGKDPGEKSIFHKEVEKAIALNKPRWFLVHHDVSVAREVWRPLLEKGIEFQPSNVIKDKEILEIYNLIHKPKRGFYKDTDRWIQEYRTIYEAEEYVQTQLKRYFGFITWINSQIQEGQSETTRFLKTWSDFDTAVKTVCAFLNSKGGRIIFGLNHSGKVIGLEVDEGEKNKFIVHLNEEISPKPIFNINSNIIKGKQVVILDVPEGEGADKPYTYSGRTFVRIGTSVQEVTSKESERLAKMMPSLGKSRWESLPASVISIDDLNQQEIIHTLEMVRKERLMSNFGDKSVKGILRSLNLLVGDTPTNAAVILFGKEPHRVFPQICIHCVQFAGTDRTDMLQLPHPFEGNLFSLIDQAVIFLETNIPRHIGTRTKNIIRESTSIIPAEAWREALINALCHRDYTHINGRINISLYKDRLEIWNSGELPPGMTLEALKQTHASRPTNPTIARVFYLRGLTELIGCGTNRIVDSCVKTGLPEPIYSLHSGGFEVKFLMFPPFVPSKRQNNLLKRLKIGGSITLTEYQKKEGKKVRERQGREDLRQLTDHGYLRKEGKGRATHYIRIK